MDTTTGLTQIGVELGTVEWLDRIIAKMRAAGVVDALASYSTVIRHASRLAVDHASDHNWKQATRVEVHRMATTGPLVMIEVDDDVECLLAGVVGREQGIVTYTPVYATAITWLLMAAWYAGFDLED